MRCQEGISSKVVCQTVIGVGEWSTMCGRCLDVDAAYKFYTKHSKRTCIQLTNKSANCCCWHCHDITSCLILYFRGQGMRIVRVIIS